MFITISPNNPDPLYKQIKDQIKTAIMAGEVKPGDTLPSIRGLAKELKTSVITIKRAYTDLEQEGFITTRQGMGSFVTDISRERLRLEKLGEIRKKLAHLTEDAARFDISAGDIIRILKELEGRFDG